MLLVAMVRVVRPRATRPSSGLAADRPGESSGADLAQAIRVVPSADQILQALEHRSLPRDVQGRRRDRRICHRRRRQGREVPRRQRPEVFPSGACPRQASLHICAGATCAFAIPSLDCRRLHATQHAVDEALTSVRVPGQRGLGAQEGRREVGPNTDDVQASLPYLSGISLRAGGSPGRSSRRSRGHREPPSTAAANIG